MVSPLTKTAPLKLTLTWKSHPILTLRQRKKKLKVAGMNLRMSATAGNLMGHLIGQKTDYCLQVLQEGALLQSPLPQDHALPHQKLCLQGSAHHPHPPPVVKSGNHPSFACLLIFMIEGSESQGPWMEGLSHLRNLPAPSVLER